MYNILYVSPYLAKLKKNPFLSFPQGGIWPLGHPNNSITLPVWISLSEEFYMRLLTCTSVILGLQIDIKKECKKREMRDSLKTLPFRSSGGTRGKKWATVCKI